MMGLIASFAVLLLACALGCAVVWRYVGLDTLRPRWAALALGLGEGIAFGLGSSSILWFLATLSVPGFRGGVVAVELVTLAWAIYAIRHDALPPSTASPLRLPWNWIGACALLAGLAIVTTLQASSWEANPQGNWDAWSIWNLRAKFIAAPGEMAARAWSPLLNVSHPEYPLLLSGAIARCWAFGANTDSAIPIAIGYLFYLSLIATATGAVALWRGVSSGLITGLVIVCTPALSAEAVSQYADVPLAAFFAGAMAFALLDRPLWAGILAGMSAWTKDEGVLFCVVLLAAMVLFRRRDAARAALGVLPAALICAGFKFWLAPHLGGLGGSGIFVRLFEFHRYPIVAAGLVRYFASLGIGWYHPLLPIAIFGAGTGVRRQGRGQAWFSTAVASALLAGYAIVVTGTANELQWQIDTAMGRLMVQWWPLAVMASMAWFRSVEETAILVEAPPAGRQRSRERHKKS